VIEDRVCIGKSRRDQKAALPRPRAEHRWPPAANIASDLLAYLQLRGLEQESELAVAEPEFLHAKIPRIPARLTATLLGAC
jgi:hypothetical protein